MLDWSVYTAVVALLVVTCTILLRHGSFDSWWEQPAKPVAASPKEKGTIKFLTLRIDEIPSSCTETTLKNDLRSILQSITELDTDLRQAIDPTTVIVHSLARRDEDRLCSTTTFHTSIPATKLVAELQKAGQKYPYLYNCDFYGITPLCESPGDDEDRVDLIAVPGLGSHALGSWRSPSSNDVWLRDYLPLDCQDIPLRVLLYGYDTKLQRSSSKQSVQDLGRSLLESIMAFREADGTEQRPVVFLGHSLGGLLVKEALVRVRRQRQADVAEYELRESCYGMIFFGVPHLGLRNEQLKSIVQGQPNASLIHDLVVDPDSEPSNFLKRISEHFFEVCNGKYRVVNFYERETSPTVEVLPDGTIQKTGAPQLLVTQESATSAGFASSAEREAIPLNTDHSGLVKYDSKYNDSYTIVRRHLKRLITDAKREVPRRFAKYNLHESHSDCTEKCLRSLAFEGMDSRLNDIDNAQEGTCSWLFEHADFEKWLSQNRGLIWIKGKPGSGKSTLLKYALRKVPEAVGIQDGNPLVLSFFFHSRGRRLQNTREGLLRSLLHQLLTQVPGALRVLTEAYEAELAQKGRYGTKWEWHYQQLWSFFTISLPQILEVYRVMIFIDALDEAGEDVATQAVDSFKELLETLPSTAYKLGIFFTCRHYPIVDFEYKLAITLDDENRADIDVYTRQRLAVISTNRAADLTVIVTQRAAGIFLWAHLVVEKILKMERAKEPPNAIEAEIQQTPRNLEEMYREVVKKMTGNAASIRLLQWLCCPSLPLSTDQLRWAMAIDPDGYFKSLKDCEKSEYFIPLGNMDARVNILSCGLAEIVRSNPPVVQFIHHSVREFFLDEGLATVIRSEKSPQVAVGEAQYLLFRCCVRYLVMDEIVRAIKASPQNCSKKFPLFGYAFFNALGHAHMAEAFEGTVSSLPDFFSWPPALLFRRWKQSIMNAAPFMSNDVDENTTLIHLAASRGLERSLSFILGELLSHLQVRDPALEIDKKDGSGNTPLAMAAKAGHGGTVRRLLGTGVVKIESKNTSGLTPLHLATEQGHEMIVRDLLQAGAQINALDGAGQSPLYRAIFSRKRSMIELMLNTPGVDINLQSPKSRFTPLHLATLMKDEPTVGLLLAMPLVDVNIKERHHQTPLLLAVDSGYEEIVELLVGAPGIDVNASDDLGVTPLLRAVDSNNVPMINMIFTVPAVLVNHQNVDGATPLHWAADLGHVEITRILLNQTDIDVNMQDEDGNTPLHVAAMRPANEVVIQLLLGTGRVDVDAKDTQGRTPLFCAADHGHREAVKLLLDTMKADANACNGIGMTPLSQAAMLGHTAVVEVLLESGRADVNAANQTGLRPLHWATLNGHKDVVVLLLNTGEVDLEAKNIKGRTALSAAVQRGRDEIAELLRRSAHGSVIMAA